MTKYLINRILRSLCSVVIVTGVIMVMIYSFLDKQSIFATDPVFTKQKSNAKQVYMMQQWEQFGYLDYVPYSDYLLDEKKAGNIDEETFATAAKLGKDAGADSDVTAQYAAKFEEEYKKIGLKVAYYRKLQGLTQEKLANKLGVATSYIGQIEAAGMYKPISLTTLLRIAEALDTPAYKFLEF